VLALPVGKEVANHDDVSDVDDVDLGRRWHSTYHSADRGNREAAQEMTSKSVLTFGVGSKV